MFKRQQLLSTAAVTALFLIGAPALAADGAKISFQKEVDACIAEINNNVDYENATRIRHTVVKLKNTFAGYVLAIDTDVFTKSDESAVREYASYCVAKGEGKPSRFRIDRKSG